MIAGHAAIDVIIPRIMMIASRSYGGNGIKRLLSIDSDLVKDEVIIAT
jgi:hypothetical protein